MSIQQFGTKITAIISEWRERFGTTPTVVSVSVWTAATTHWFYTPIWIRPFLNFVLLVLSDHMGMLTL